METIHFNTGRAYTEHGQRISATQHDDGRVTFYDHDRMIFGEIEDITHFSRVSVLDRYDRNNHHHTPRAYNDALMPGGANSKYPENQR